MGKDLFSDTSRAKDCNGAGSQEGGRIVNLLTFDKCSTLRCILARTLQSYTVLAISKVIKASKKA